MSKDQSTPGANAPIDAGVIGPVSFGEAMAEVKRNLVHLSWRDFKAFVSAVLPEDRLVPGMYAANFDPEALEYAGILDAMLMPSDVSTSTLPKDWEVTFWATVAVPVTLPGEGEETVCFKTVLMNPRGFTLGSLSKGIAKSVIALAAMHGDSAPYDPPIRVVFEYTKLPNGRNWNTFHSITRV